MSIQQENNEVQLSLAARLALRYLEAEGINLEVINRKQQRYRLEKTIFTPLQNHDGGYVDADVGGYQILLNFRGVSDTFDHLRDTSDYSFRLIGRVKVKGKSQTVSVFDVFDADPPPLHEKKLKTKTMFEQALCLYSQQEWSKAAKLFQQCLEFLPEDKTAKIYRKRCQN